MALYNQAKMFFHIVDMDFPKISDKKNSSSSIKFNIFRQMMMGTEDESISCIEFLKDELFMAYNINIVNLLSLQNA